MDGYVFIWNTCMEPICMYGYDFVRICMEYYGFVWKLGFCMELLYGWLSFCMEVFVWISVVPFLGFG